MHSGFIGKLFLFIVALALSFLAYAYFSPLPPPSDAKQFLKEMNQDLNLNASIMPVYQNVNISNGIFDEYDQSLPGYKIEAVSPKSDEYFLSRSFERDVVNDRDEIDLKAKGYKTDIIVCVERVTSQVSETFCANKENRTQ